MKKCTSCTKDLPDAALHCVFCGGKQPPTPAVQQGVTKTAFGYPTNDVIEQMRQQAVVQGRPTPPTAKTLAGSPVPSYPRRPTPAPIAPSSPPPRPAPATAPPPPHVPFQPAPEPPEGVVPASLADVPTMIAPSGPMPSPEPRQPAMPPSRTHARQDPAAAMMPTLVSPQPQPQPTFRPQPPAPIVPLPATQPPPCLTSQTASNAIRPVEPWRDSLRLMMFVWGGALLAVFATPLRTSPELLFNWDLVLDSAGTARLPLLTVAAVGLLSVIVAAIPMLTAARGSLATLLGLAGILVPIALGGMPPWLLLVSMLGMLLLVPSLLVRDEYRDAVIPRILVTLGAAGVVLPYILPQDGAIPLVSVLMTLIDTPGSGKGVPALTLGLLTIAVMSLLAWLPAPVTGAAAIWAWLLILWTLIVHVAQLLLGGNVFGAITSTPNAVIVPWIAGGGTGGGSATSIALGSAYLVLVGYGLASVLGKQLE